MIVNIEIIPVLLEMTHHGLDFAIVFVDMGLQIGFRMVVQQPPTHLHHPVRARQRITWGNGVMQQRFVAAKAYQTFGIGKCLLWSLQQTIRDTLTGTIHQSRPGNQAQAIFFCRVK